MKTDFDWDSLSLENLKVAQKVIRVVSDFLEFQPGFTSKLSFVDDISLKKFEDVGVNLEDVRIVLNIIDGIKVARKQASDAKLTIEFNSPDDLRRVKNLLDEKLAVLDESKGKNATQKLQKLASSHKLPAGSKWENVEIKFKDKFDIEVLNNRRFFKTLSHDQLGFDKSGTKDKKPDIQWHFLYSLAVLQHLKPQTATIEHIAKALGAYVGKNNYPTGACTKVKSKLAQALQDNFGINDDPFYDYNEKGYYQTKFKLKPEPELRGDGEPFLIGTGYDDAKRYNTDEAVDDE